jgi:hypothetical protein
MADFVAVLLDFARVNSTSKDAKLHHLDLHTLSPRWVSNRPLHVATANARTHAGSRLVKS